MKIPRIKGKTVKKAAPVFVGLATLFFAVGYSPVVKFCEKQGWISDEKAENLIEKKEEYRKKAEEVIKTGSDKISGRTNEYGEVKI